MPDIMKHINESRFEKGRGSKEGRSKAKSSGKVESEKSKVKIYDTIDDALKHGYFGQIFSTKGSDRLYVISKHKWGKDADQRVGNKIAKGFTPGSATPGATFKDIKGYSARTMIKHGEKGEKALKSKQFFKSGYRGKR